MIGLAGPGELPSHYRKVWWGDLVGKKFFPTKSPHQTIIWWGDLVGKNSTKSHHQTQIRRRGPDTQKTQKIFIFYQMRASCFKIFIIVLLVIRISHSKMVEPRSAEGPQLRT